MNQREDYEVEYDQEDDLQQRLALLEEVKAFEMSENWLDNAPVLSDFRRRWKSIPYYESAYEDELQDQFESLMDDYYKVRNESLQESKDIKQQLIEQAKQLVNDVKLKSSTNKMKELMANWKLAGSAGREEDDELWASFNAAQQAFYDKKHELWEEMQKGFEVAKVKKEALIEELKESVMIEDLKEAQAKVNAHMKEWKAIGSAGRDAEDGLWETFNGIRQEFYKVKEERYEAMKEEFEENYKQKKALKEEAQRIVESGTFTREQTNRMKELSQEWKAIGFAGENENTLWKEYRLLADAYFHALKEAGDLRQAQWRDRMNESRQYKMDLIQKQQRQIQYMEQEIVGLLGERAIQEMKEDIEDCKAFIVELEAEIKDIDEKLAK